MELSGGKVLLRVSIDGETKVLRTSRKYNNGQWTLVDIAKFGELTFEVNQMGRSVYGAGRSGEKSM